jgi:SAM-dependent methyltransferase
MSNSPQANPLLDPFVPAASAWSIVAAASAGVFDALGEDPRSPTDIADELGLDAAGVGRLMPVLVHLGYAETDGGCYRASLTSREHLTAGSPRRLSNWVRFCRTQLLAMSYLESRLSSGREVDLFDLMKTPDELRVHQLAMAETAAPVADWVAEHTPVPEGAMLMLDIGGSHGLYSAAICRRNPPLRAEVLELPGVIDAARSAATELGTTDLVTHIEGDIRNTFLARDYSVVFLGNLIHHMKLEQLPGLFEKLRDHLLPGGTIAIWDIREDREARDLVSDLFSLFFYLTSAGRCHSQRQIQTALHEAGLDQFQAVQPEGPSLHSLFLARRPTA